MFKKRSKSDTNYSKKIFCVRHPECTRYSQLHEFCETSNSSDENGQFSTQCVENLKIINSKQIGVIASLIIEKGMPANRLKTKEDLMLIAKFIEQGATAAIVSQAFDRAAKITSNRSKKFDMRYLSSVVGDMLKNNNCNLVPKGNDL